MKSAALFLSVFPRGVVFLLLLCGFPSAAVFLLATHASAVIMGVDAFDYSDGPVAGQTGGVSWDRSNAAFFPASGGASNWDNVSNAPTVFLGRLVTNNSSAKREYKGSPESDGAFSETSHVKVVYYRATVTTGPVLPDFFGVSSFDFGTERVFWGKRFGQANFGIETTAGGNVSSGVAMLPNTAYTLVAKLDFANNLLALWVNPDLTTGVETVPTVTLAYTLSFPSTAVRLASGNTGSGVTWDDITVATSWSDLALVVNTFLDEDSGTLGGTQSLRECLKYGPKGATILFHPGLDGFPISLSAALGEMVVAAGQDFIVDASALANGSTINDGAANSFRLLRVDAGARLEVRGVTFADAGASAGSLEGGAVRNQGTLTLTRCSLERNAAGNGSGGALYSSGTLIANQCTFSGNSAVSGGAVESAGDSRLVHCTLTKNTAAASGGAVRNSQLTTTLLHCTVAENIAGNSGGGVVSVGDNVTHTNVRHSIISGNAGGDVDLVGGAVNSFASQGRNLIGTGGATGAFNQPSDIISNLDPLLTPLGSYGGRTQTMPPLAGSPAIDAAAVIANLDADQRGAVRNFDGNADAIAVPDIGAVESAFRFVFNPADSGGGTLRQVLLDAAATPGWESITFLIPLNGGTISLTSFSNQAALEVNDPGGVAIDATSLTNGLTITKPAGNYRFFNVAAGSSLALHRLTLTGGGGPAFFAGGAISNAGGLVLTRCSFSQNKTTQQGGAIKHTGTDFLALNCTFSANTAADSAGAIDLDGAGRQRVAHCTFTDNRTTLGGALVVQTGRALDLVHTTVTANDASAFGAIRVRGTLRMTNCLVAGNTASAGEAPDIAVSGGSVIPAGVNLLSSLTGSGLVAGANVIVGAPLLAPLGNYGGFTQTMPPRPGSPAIDAAVGVLAATDQRGLPRVREGDGIGSALPDIGAVEASIFVVTTDADSGAGSLRQTLADAAAMVGADTITFLSSALNGGTISLSTFASGSALTVNDAAGVTLDASTLTNGLTITKGAGTFRLFRVNGGVCALDSLTLKGGTSAGGSAVFNFATVVLTRCTLSQNNGTATAGAVLNAGTLTLDRCTLSDNTGVQGGGLLNDTSATANVVNCTFTANSASDTGGAIFNSGTLTVRHATIVENSAANDAGGISNGGTLTLGNTIVAGNFVSVPTTRNDLRGGGTFTTQGGNLLGENSVVSASFPAGLPNVNNDFAGTPTAPLDPRLLPLGKYNGVTPTMPPLAGSRAIDAGVNLSLDATDQRGLSRNEDSDNNGVARPDIGAVEAVFRFVTTDADSGTGSLRQAIADAASVPGWEAIAFSSALNGGTISLTSQAFSGVALQVNDAGGVSIDASSLPAGLTITKPAGNYGLLFLSVNARLSLHQLTLTGGNTAGDFGGAIYNGGGFLRVHDCTLTGNQAAVGGAIYSFTNLPTEIRRCTITGNIATSSLSGGGAIRNDGGSMNILFSTVSGNSAPNSGGISSRGDSSASTVVTSSIVSANPGGDVVIASGGGNSFTSQGHNLIGTGNATGAFTVGQSDIVGVTAPLLAPLDNYGGATKTMALMPGSLARNTGSGAAFDQRGFAIFNPPDIGAYETGTLTNFNAFIWETLPTTATAAQHASTFDFDGDGAANLDEFFAGTTITSPLSVLRVTSVVRSGANVNVTFPSVPGRNYTLENTTDFATWTLLPGSQTVGTGNPITAIVGPVTGFPRLFLRIRVGP